MFNPEDMPIFIEDFIEEIEIVEPVPMGNGITRRTLSTGQQFVLSLFEWGAGALLPVHLHPASKQAM